MMLTSIVLQQAKETEFNLIELFFHCIFFNRILFLQSITGIPKTLQQVLQKTTLRGVKYYANTFYLFNFTVGGLKNFFHVQYCDNRNELQDLQYLIYRRCCIASSWEFAKTRLSSLDFNAVFDGRWQMKANCIQIKVPLH